MNELNIEKLDFTKCDGLLPAVIQDSDTKAVLMLGFMNEEASKKTIKDGRVTFYSRTKKRLWQKGETSGNFLNVVSISQDCDNDTLLIMVKPVGPTCHTGDYSCFEGIEKEKKTLDENSSNCDFAFFKVLFNLIEQRKREMPEGSYTTSLFKDGLDQILAKVEEESDEVIEAAKNETKLRLIEESCDLLYHMMVLLVEKDVGLADIVEELEKRFNK